MRVCARARVRARACGRPLRAAPTGTPTWPCARRCAGCDLHGPPLAPRSRARTRVHGAHAPWHAIGARPWRRTRARHGRTHPPVLTRAHARTRATDARAHSAKRLANLQRARAQRNDSPARARARARTGEGEDDAQADVLGQVAEELEARHHLHRRVLTGYSRGTRGALTRCLGSTRAVLARYSLETNEALPRYSRGAHAVLTRGPAPA